MSMVCGLDLHRQQITFDAVETESGRGVAGSGVAARSGTVPALARAATSLGAPAVSRWRWPWRAAPAGATWSRRSPPPASKRTWRSRPTRRRRGAASAAPRPIVHDARLLRELLQSRRAARVVDPADDRVGVARTGPAVQVAGRSTTGRGSSGSTPSCSSTASPCPRQPIRSADTRERLLSDEVDLTPAGRQRVRVGYSMIDATDVEAQPLKRRPATLRSSPAGVPGAGRRHLRDRWVDRRWRCGPSSATAAASPAPSRWSATPVWTSPSTPPTATAPVAT